MDNDRKKELYEAFQAGFLVSLLRPSMGHVLTGVSQLQKDFETYLKAREPKKQKYQCLKCKQPTAEKQPDIQGWDGYCSKCGMIAQIQVGEPVDIADEITELREFLIVSGVLK